MSTMLPAYARIFADYDRQRRLNLLRIITPFFYIVESLFLVSSFLLLLGGVVGGRLGSPQGFALIETTISSAVINVVYGLAWHAARRGQVGRASWLITFPTTLSFMISCVAQSARDGPSPLVLSLLAGFVVVIALAGALGGRGQLITITALSAIGAVGTMLVAAALHGDTLGSVQMAALAFFIVADLAEFAIFLAVQQSSRVSIAQLGELRLAVERAEQLDDLKNQFISSVNHELRNPIMGMLGHLDNLVNAPPTTPVERLRRNADRALQSAFRLRRLVDSILDARRMDQHAGEFDPAPVNVLDALHAAIQLIDPAEAKLVERDLHIAMPADLTIQGETIRLQQILTNLISNALKYSPLGSPVTILGQVMPEKTGETGKRSVAAQASARMMAEITVQDHGLGIPPDQAPLLFNKFVRLPRDLASTVVGNGLGLHLCKVLAEAMGGRIWVESSGLPNEGSTFHVLLPLASTADAYIASSPTAIVTAAAPTPYGVITNE